MVVPGSGVVRCARAAAWACAAGGLSVGAHVVGGGGLPSAGGAALLAVTLLWGGLLLTRWRLGRTALTLSLGLTQAVVHALLSASEHPPVCASAGGGHHGMVTACADGSMGHSPGAAMLLAHAVAALLLALVLARGEDAVWFVAGLLRPCLPTVTRLRVPSLRSPAPEPWGGLPRSVTVLGGVGRRGPPVRRALA